MDQLQRGHPPSTFIPKKTLLIDIETFSSVDIGKAGSYRYIESDDFEILLFSYSYDFGPVQLVDLTAGESIPAEVIADLSNPGVIKTAWNSAFEWRALNRYWPSPISQWQDIMIHSLYLGLVAKLETAGEVVGLPQDKRKMAAGKTLIRLFCKPVKPTKNNGGRTRTQPHHEPEKWKLFKDYNRQDVATEAEIEKRLSRFPVPEAVWDEWRLEMAINARGIALDEPLIDGALAIDRTETRALMAEAREITGLSNPNSTSQLLRWLTEKGVQTSDLQKATVADLINQTTGDVQRVLRIRQQLSKTSIKKYKTMKATVCTDGRIRGTMQFYGANRSGREAGRLLQPQNMARNSMETLDFARELVEAKKVDTLRLVYGNTADVLSQLTRTAIVAAPGHKIVVADFNAIEARVIAWLSGEEWRLNVFRTHGKIYEASASQMFGVPIDSIKHGDPVRQQGKVAELANGYGGSVGAMKRMDFGGKIRPNDLSDGACQRFAAENGMACQTKDDYRLVRDAMIDANYKRIVDKWRAASPNIVRMWRTYENAALSVMRTGRPAGANHVLFARESDIVNGLDFLTVTLPSGRKLYYAHPFIAPNQFDRDALYYYGLDQTTHKWSRVSTYGGKIVENVTQAVARDCLFVAMRRLTDAGYPIVMTIHDEVVLDVLEEQADLDRVIEIMKQPIDWAPGLPLNADGFVSDYYKKDD